MDQIFYQKDILTAITKSKLNEIKVLKKKNKNTLYILSARE